MMVSWVGWPQATPGFEVASVKPSGDGRLSLGGGPGTSDPVRISYENATLKTLLMQAYAVDRDQISAPNWIDSEKYSIVAKIPPGTGQGQFQIMLQNLLTDRFKLSLHHETKEFTAYELVIAKGGPKLTPAAPMDSIETGPPPGQANRSDKGGCPVAPQVGVRSRRDSFPSTSIDGCSRYTKSSLADLANALSTFISMQEGGMPAFANNVVHVIDKTGLPGEYDFTLRFHFKPAVTLNSTGAASDPEGTTIATALEQQLGLKLQKTKMLLDVVVVDRAEKVPTEN